MKDIYYAHTEKYCMIRPNADEEDEEEDKAVVSASTS